MTERQIEIARAYASEVLGLPELDYPHYWRGSADPITSEEIQDVARHIGELVLECQRKSWPLSLNDGATVGGSRCCHWKGLLWNLAEAMVKESRRLKRIEHSERTD